MAKNKSSEGKYIVYTKIFDKSFHFAHFVTQIVKDKTISDVISTNLISLMLIDVQFILFGHEVT